jgi:hypothetical protein
LCQNYPPETILFEEDEFEKDENGDDERYVHRNMVLLLQVEKLHHSIAEYLGNILG